MYERVSELSHSPWGRVDWQAQPMPGVINLSTSSHGGYFLGVDRWQALKARFPSFLPHAGAPWLEEDQDAVLVPLTFPDEVDGWALYRAVASVRSMASGRYWKPPRHWLDVADWLLMSPDGKAVVAKAVQWEREHAHLWQVGSMGTGPGKPGWSVSLTRIGDGKRQQRRFFEPGGPDKTLYSDAELIEHSKPD